MLIVAAAILYSSVHLFGVAGATPEPSNAAPLHTVSDVIDVAPVQGAATTPELSAPVEGVPEVSLAACGASDGKATASTVAVDYDPSGCLSALTAVTPAALTRFGTSLDVDSGQDVSFATALGERATAEDVSTWWAGLDADRRNELASSVPGVVGNLEGVPYAARDIANRVALTETTAKVARQVQEDGTGFAGMSTPARRLVMLQQVKIALDRGREGNDTPRSLVSLDTVFPGRAAVSVGDLDTADDVSVMVPGMLYTVSNQITFWTDRAADLQTEQSFWSNNLATSTTKRPGTTATVAWMGYRTPDLTNVLGLSLAKAGAVHLEDTVTGLKAVRSADEPRVTVIAHSYGSTAATIALSSGRIHVDSFVVLGSPGSVVARAASLAVTHGSVYAAAAALDPVAGSGFFGVDPGATVFGATLLNVGGGTDPYTEQALTPVFTHNHYFTPGSQSMRNLALIGTGHGDLVQGRAPVPNGPAPLNGPTLAFVRPQDVNRESLSA